MKKILTLVFLSFVLVGCGNKPQTEPNNNPAATGTLESNTNEDLPSSDPSIGVEIDPDAPLPETDPSIGVEIDPDAPLPESDPTVDSEINLDAELPESDPTTTP